MVGGVMIRWLAGQDVASKRIVPDDGDNATITTSCCFNLHEAPQAQSLRAQKHYDQDGFAHNMIGATKARVLPLV